MIEGHGDDLFRFNEKIRINFSTNIPQNVNHDALLDHLRACGAILATIPNPSREVLKGISPKYMAYGQNRS